MKKGKTIIMYATLFVIGISINSCQTKKSELEQKLENYVIARSGDKCRYKLISYETVDSVTNGMIKDSLENDLKLICIEKPTIEEFKKYRNQEFKVFRREPSYEYDVMKGKLKDASDWCKEIRIITETADSLIKIWDNVDPYSYDMNRIVIWYMHRAANFYNIEQKYKLQNLKDIIESEQTRKLFTDYHLYKEKDSNEIFEYHVTHTYSFYNPLLKNNITETDLVYFDKNHNFIKSEMRNNILDLIEQVVK